jgi:hypothetical protein
MAKQRQKINEADFDALEQFAHGITPETMRPLSPALRRRWQAAKRGRPRKAPGTKAVPTLITVDPRLLKRIDAGARKAGLSRSEFLANAARRQLQRVG